MRERIGKQVKKKGINGIINEKVVKVVVATKTAKCKERRGW